MDGPTSQGVRPRAHRRLPPLQPEDYLGILRSLVLSGWVGAALALALEVWIRTSGVLIWPRIGGFSKNYNIVLIEFVVINALLTLALVWRTWFERLPRKQIRRLRLLLVFVSVWQIAHFLAMVHVSGSTQGPLITAFPLLAMGAYLVLPRAGAHAYTLALIAGYAGVVIAEDRGKLFSPGLLAAAFDLEGVGVMPAMTVLLIFAILSIIVGNLARTRFDGTGTMLHRPSIFDDLTGLYNRDFFMDRVPVELARSARQGSPVSLVFAEVDGFDVINSTLGYEGGTDVLASIGVQIEKSIRSECDTPARIAPTIFGILLPTAAEEGAMVVLRRLTNYAATINLQQEGITHVTFSFAIVSTEVPGEVDPGEFIEAGRAALVEAVGWGGAQLITARLPRADAAAGQTAG